MCFILRVLLVLVKNKEYSVMNDQNPHNSTLSHVVYNLLFNYYLYFYYINLHNLYEFLLYFLCTKNMKRNHICGRIKVIKRKSKGINVLTGR